MAFSKFFSFAEIIKGRDASVRVTDDDLVVAVDLVMVMSGKERDYAGQMLRRIPEDLFPTDKNISVRNLPGKGNTNIKLVSFENAIELIMVLPGKTAKLVRKHLKDIIVRYLEGDTSMCYEIESNQAMGRVESCAKFAGRVMKKMDEEKDKRNHTMPQTFYVYATKSPAFPGLIKIGKTENVSRRVCQLNTACAPAPHVIVAVAPSFDKGRDETTAHAFFSNARREGEFFELQDAEVLAYFATHITARYNTELGQNIAKLHGLSV